MLEMLEFPEGTARRREGRSYQKASAVNNTHAERGKRPHTEQVHSVGVVHRKAAAASEDKQVQKKTSGYPSLRSDK